MFQPLIFRGVGLDGYYCDIYYVREHFFATCRLVVKQFLVVVKMRTAVLKVCMSLTFTLNIEEWNDFGSLACFLSFLRGSKTITRWWFQIFVYFQPCLEKIPILTNISQRG